jgi:hypothetical protein
VLYVNRNEGSRGLLTLRTVWVLNVNIAAADSGELTKCTPTSPTQRS